MKTALLLSAAALALTPTVLFAQDQGSDSWVAEVVVTGRPDSIAAPEAATATRTATPLIETPQSIQVLPRTLIEEQDLQTLSDALVNVSGVTPTSDLEIVLQPPLIRGFPANYYFDGMPTYGLPEGVADPATLINVERIEIAKGPTSTLYGGGSGAPLSGLINVVSKTPGDTLTGSVGARFGSFETRGAQGEIEAPLAGGAVGLRLAGLYETADSYIDVVDSRRSALFPTLRWDISDDTRLVIRGQFTRLEQREYAGLPAALTIAPALVIDRYAFAGAEDAPRTRIDNDLLTATLSHRFNDSLKGEVSISRFEGSFREYSTFPLAQLAGTTYAFGSGLVPSDTEKTFVTASLVADLGKGNVRHRVLVGMDYDTTDYYGAMGLNLAWGIIDYANPATNAPFGAVPALSDLQNDDLESIALFVQDQISIGDRIDVTAGLRWTRLDLKSSYTSFGVPFVATDESYDEVTPRLGVTWRVADGIALFAGYAEGFKGTVASFGVTDPKPETSQSYEGGLKFDVKTIGLSGTLSAFQVTRQNVTTSDPANPFLSIQAGEQRARGVEADVIYEPTPALSLLFSYAYTDAEVTKDNTLPVGDSLRRVPRHSGRLAARYRFQGPLKGLEIGAGVTAVSSRELTLPNTTSVDGLTLVDAQAAYDFGPASISLSIANLTDEDGFEPYQYFGGQYVAPTQPRSAFITIRAGF
jgi:iron complex outermembrane receptor protein